VRAGRDASGTEARGSALVRVVAFGTIDIAKNFYRLGREGLEMDTCAHFELKKEPGCRRVPPSRAPFLIDTRERLEIELSH
jgi:hypothetical protein